MLALYAPFAPLLTALFGLLIGSFLNAAEYRLAHGLLISWTSGRAERSRCPLCQNQLRWFELMPVVSFILQRGRCRHCDKTISVQYPLVELATAIVMTAPVVVLGPTLPAALITLFAPVLVFIFLYDLKHQLILDRVTIPALIAALIASVWLNTSLLDTALGVVIGAGFFFVQYVLSRGTWIGGGDIRLGALMGVLLGWQQTIVALLLAYVAGAAVAVVLLAMKRAGRKTALPFGTFLTAATMVSLLWGEHIIDWYLQLVLP